MTREIHTLTDALEAMNEERSLNRADVPQRVQAAKIWQAIVSFPGCLGDAFSVARSKEDALSSVEYWLDDEREYSPRYVRGQLRRFGICYLRRGRVITLGRMTVGEMF